MKLLGKSLKLLHITRQSIIDADYVGVCANCGKPIVNIATIEDIDTGEKFDIGLDCKKTLIDKKLFDTITDKWQLKELKSDINTVQKLLTLLGNESNTVKFDGNDLIIEDSKPNNLFPELTGNIVFYESIPYLIRIGISGEFLNQLRWKLKK